MFAFGVVGLLSVATIALSNVACEYLNYPTQAIFKCCKLLPVMIMGMCYFRKTYTLLEYLAIVLLTAGLIIFSAGNSMAETKFDPIGVVIICLALVADALIGNVQEYVLKTYRASTSELMFYTKLFGLGFLLVTLVATGELLPGMRFMWANRHVYFFFLAFSIAGCVGEFFVLILVQRFGALIAVVTTSIRKVFSVFLSFLVFPKPFTWAYGVGMLLVFSGVGLEIFLKNRAASMQVLNRIKAYILSNLPISTSKPSSMPTLEMEKV